MHAKHDQVTAKRIGVLMIGAATLFAILIMKLYFMQIVDAPKIVASSERARNFLKILPPTRGLILDRHSRPLAQNTITYTVTACNESIENPTAAMMQVGGILDLPHSVINRHIAALQRDGVVWREIDKEIPEEIKEKIEAAGIPGLYFKTNTSRIYPEKTLASHVVGFTGSDGKGLAGLELTLNDNLEGTAQPIVTDKDIRRRMIAEDDYTKIMTRGVDYVLTIDSYIQYVVERELKKICEETAALQANAVIMHPKTGDILAMANYPTYDPNHYADYNLDLRRNRLLVDVFEPGSVLKPFVLSAALEQRVVTPQTTFYCEKGAYYFRGHTIRDDIHRFDNLTVYDILVRSSNIGMVKITQRLGKNPDDYRGQAEILYDYLTRFGFKNTGEKTVQELPGESGGILHHPSRWWPANIGAAPFGQGISTNTLVLTAAYSALANRGLYVDPRIILGKRRPDGLFQPDHPAAPRRILSNRVAEQIVQMMIDVTEDPEGTGRRIRVPGFHIAGKTGTAQKVNPEIGTYGRGMRIASFAGFFPAQDPQAVIVVVVDEPKKKKYGGEVSGPVFQKIVEELIAYWGLSPSDKSDPLFIAAMNTTNKNEKNELSNMADQVAFGVTRQMPIPLFPEYAINQGRMPNLIGLPIREAFIRLAANGLQARFEGSGKVTEQPIPAGDPVQGRTEIGIVRCEPMLTDPEIQTNAEWVVQR
ncbi:MAG: transpeptidase family protein [Candidatus Omnitrophica bacterium]|nr:transpeptidase family protein [Candidatus Omnitrophota bacterium]